MDGKETIRPDTGTKVPRYAGAATFLRLPELRDVDECDIAVLGIPFDSGVSFRPGARFGPSAVRQASRLLRPQFHPSYGMEPLAILQAADAGDISCNPFDIGEAIDQIERQVEELQGRTKAILSIGGDHTVVLPVLRSMYRRHGQVSLVHFDAHLDTWDTYFGAPYTHGTPSCGAPRKKGCSATTRRCTLGSAGRCTAGEDLVDDERFGFRDRSAPMTSRASGSMASIESHPQASRRPPSLRLASTSTCSTQPTRPGTGTPEIGGC